MTWLRSSSITLDGYGSKIRKTSRRRPAVLNETILVTRQEFFFTKVTPVKSMTDIIGFVINAAALNMFFGWERGNQLSTYATVEVVLVTQNAYRGRGCHALCVRKHLNFSFFCSIFVLVSCFICRNLTLPSFKKDVFVRNGYFSLTRSTSVVME